MLKHFLRLAIVAACLAMPALLVSADSKTEELDPIHQLEKWKADPEHYARLRHDLRAFLALPAERQAQLRMLDQALHEEDSATYAKLHRTLERYNDWLQALPEVDRQRVQNATHPRERLEVIKQLREREWVNRLPKTVREELQKLPADKQTARIAELRQEERARQAEWRYAVRHWEELTRPPASHLKDFPEPVQLFVKESLRPMLSREEKDRLDKAEGHWPLFPQTLVELSDKHPIRLPGPTTGPTRWAELPEDVRVKVSRFFKNPPPRLVERVKEAEGKWPEYAELVTQVANAQKIELPRQLGPCRPTEFSLQVQQFIEKRLLPALSSQEVDELKNGEGHWPRYANRLLILSRKHRLPVPGMVLPGPRATWDKFRVTSTTRAASTPEVADKILREFLRTELSAEEKAGLPSLSLADPMAREQIKQAYFRHHPGMLANAIRADEQKKSDKGKDQPAKRQ